MHALNVGLGGISIEFRTYAAGSTPCYTQPRGQQHACITLSKTWTAACAHACAGDGPEWNALQPEAGVFDERVFASLDWVIAEAGARGMHLSLPLINYWAAYGGIPQYVRCGQRAAPSVRSMRSGPHLSVLLSLIAQHAACLCLPCSFPQNQIMTSWEPAHAPCPALIRDYIMRLGACTAASA
jgi:hypothetical protein